MNAFESEHPRKGDGKFVTKPVDESGNVALLTGTTPYADFDPERVNYAVTEATRRQSAEYIEHASGLRYDADENRQGSSCGDTSIGAEPSVRMTWATGNPEEPFITVTETFWVNARLSDGEHDLDYDDWTEAAARLERADEADEQADGIYAGISHLTDNDRGSANLEIDRLRRLAAGIRDESPAIQYAVENTSEWIAHTDVNDPSGSEVRSNYEHDGSSVYYSSLENAEANARSRAKFTEPDMYSPLNWE